MTQPGVYFTLDAPYVRVIGLFSNSLEDPGVISSQSDAACSILTWSPATARCGFFTLLHDALPVLLNFGEPGTFDITPWADRVQLTDANYLSPWELPGIGAITPPAAVLVRPDGYVAGWET